jgi:hypothetical protein
LDGWNLIELDLNALRLAMRARIAQREIVVLHRAHPTAAPGTPLA